MVVVWITGASRGIGEVLAKQLANLGAKLIISARNEAELERVKKQLTGKHAPDGVKVLPLDLASGEDCLRDAVEKAESFFLNAGVDFMIHNAAIERPVSRQFPILECETLLVVETSIDSLADLLASGFPNSKSAPLHWHKTTALDVTEESLKSTFNVNVLGTITLTRLLAPYMLRRGKGHFVVMSSAAGKMPAPGQAVYSASKHALNGTFTHCAPRVTIVCPGPIETSTGSGAASSENKASSEKRVSSERCAELTIVAATHCLKEVWISYQPVLTVMYLVQYVPTVGYWLMDKIGGNRVEAAARKGNTYSISLLFGKKKAS
ncbi:NAD(P)-binding Rossmann-fold superfamily protein [Prunus dulcis]|uniref:NAD(P)-binding Rossmann-fold superfamily protein n=1 Tax=Prunus dulcis TaxID=3755 RepID=A0A4Y1RSS3_PRUDU|nr:NAD(P)-binding Rossmann-fold superfamily protein [Prunus dulcis]